MHQGREQRMRAKVRQFIGEFIGGFSVDARRATHAESTRVQAFFHAHDAHACFLVARQQRALHRCSPAPARQQRRVHVQAAMARNIQHRLGQNSPVCGNANDLGFKCGQFRLRLFGAQRAGREHRKTQALGRTLHRRRLQLLAAAAYGIGARVDGHHFVLLRQVFQNGGRELRRAHEHDAHD